MCVRALGRTCARRMGICILPMGRRSMGYAGYHVDGCAGDAVHIRVSRFVSKLGASSACGSGASPVRRAMPWGVI